MGFIPGRGAKIQHASQQRESAKRPPHSATSAASKGRGCLTVLLLLQGLAVLVPRQYIASEEPANNDNYTYVLQIKGRQMSYKVTYCSANETFGYHAANEWFDYLKAWCKEVEKPVVVNIKEN